MKFTNHIIIALLVALILLFYFHRAISNSEVIKGGDLSYGESISLHKNVENFFKPSWQNHYWMGLPSPPYSPNMRMAIFKMLSATPISHNFSVILPFILMFISSYLLFATFTKSRSVPLLIALLYSFSPMIFSFLFVGHIGKLYQMAFVPLSFYFLSRGMFHSKYKTKIFNYFLCGIFLGQSILEAFDSGVFFALLLTTWYVFNIVSTLSNITRKKIFLSVIIFMIIPLVSFSISGASLLEQIGNTKDHKVASATFSNETDKRLEKKMSWSWATQWSFPPSETIEFIFPGFYGLYSGSSHAPYWGSIGRSLDWNPGNKNVVTNFSLNSNYPGIIILIFAIFGSMQIRKKENIFWLLISIVLLLLSFGRHFEVFYRLFYNIPYMNTFRNPNKFLHLFQLSITFLAFYGILQIRNVIKEKVSFDLKNITNTNHFIASHKNALIVFFIIATIALIIIMNSEKSLRLALDDVLPNPQYKVAIRHSQTAAYTGYLFLTMAAVFLFSILTLIGRVKKAKELLLIALISGCFAIGFIDQWRVNRHYLKYEPSKIYTESNELIDYLKTEFKNYHGRAKLFTKGSYLDFLLDWLSPIHGIEFADIPAIRTIPQDINVYLKRMQYKIPLYFQLWNVNLVLSDGPIVTEMPLKVFENPMDNKKSIFIYKLPTSQPRGYLGTDIYPFTNDEECFKALSSPHFIMGHTVVVDSKKINRQQQRGSEMLSNRTKVLSYNPMEVIFESESSVGGIFVFLTYFDLGWKVTVNGLPGETYKVNYLNIGTTLPPGKNLVAFKYQPRQSLILKITPFIYYGYVSILAIIVLIFVVTKMKKFTEIKK